jgi:molecular chaperone HtpG
MADPVDAFMMVRLNEYQDHKLVNVADAELEIPGSEDDGAEEVEETGAEDLAVLLESFKSQLGDKISDVRVTRRLSESPARLVDPEGALNQEMQRVYRMLNQEYEVPQKVLELNPQHAIIKRLNELPAEEPKRSLVIEQIYEDALLIEGLHPDPASMIGRIQKLMEAALD